MRASLEIFSMLSMLGSLPLRVSALCASSFMYSFRYSSGSATITVRCAFPSSSTRRGWRLVIAGTSAATLMSATACQICDSSGMFMNLANRWVSR